MSPFAGPKQALLCLLPGLGDALTASTLIRRLRADGHIVDVLAMLRPVEEYAGALADVRRVVFAPMLQDLRKSFQPLADVRRARYDLCVLPFPATRWQYAAVARMSGAKTIVAHEYGGFFSVLLSGAQRVTVPLMGGHRLWENDRLADALDLPTVSDYSYLVPDSWRSKRINGVLGIHPGTMVYKGNEARRWPFDRFVEVVREQIIAGRTVRVFFGPSELEDEARLRDALCDERLQIVTAPLREAVRKLSECEVFLGNDAGFSHLAAAVGVKTLTLFGMTNPERATPIGSALAMRPSACPPCHDEGMRGFECVRKINFRCLNEDLSVQSVNSEISRLFEVNTIRQDVVRMGPFSLYGKLRNLPAATAGTYSEKVESTHGS